MGDWDDLALDDAVLNTTRDVFGQAVVYTPAALPAENIVAIFDLDYQAVDLETGTLSSLGPVLFIRDADLTVAPRAHDDVVISGAAYKVAERQQDKHGGSRLLLRKVI